MFESVSEENVAERKIRETVAELEKLGYTCRIKEENDMFLASCAPSKFEIFYKDRINKIEVVLPKNENLVNISVISKEPLDLSKVNEWIEKSPLFGRTIFVESKYYEVESKGKNAYSIAPDLAKFIINIQRKNR